MRPSHPITLAEIENSTVRKGVDLWQELRGARPMPSRAQMSPRLLSGILKNSVLVRALANGTEFEMRIVGDAVVQAQGASLQGMTMAEIDLVLPGYGSLLRKVYAWTCRNVAPGTYRGWYIREADGHSMYHESAVLPLSDDGRTVDHLLVVGVYAMQPGDMLR